MKISGIFTILSVLVLFTLPSQAQNLTPPDDGAAVRLMDTKLEVSTAKEFSTDVWLVKSKRYTKRAFGNLQAKAPKGVEIYFQPKDDNKNVFTMNIKVTEEADLGKYMVIIKGSGENSQKVKSSLLSLVIGDGTIAGVDKE